MLGAKKRYDRQNCSECDKLFHPNMRPSLHKRNIKGYSSINLKCALSSVSSQNLLNLYLFIYFTKQIQRYIVLLTHPLLLTAFICLVTSKVYWPIRFEGCCA